MPSSFERFILENEEAGTSRLLLSRVEWPSPPDDSLVPLISGKELAVSTIEARKKLRDKVPEWYSMSSLVYPTTLAAEQCSSSVTAGYKASLAKRILGGAPGRIADLTGGLGVDSWAFSSIASEVLYNERNPLLVAAVRHNYSELGVCNVLFSNHEITADSVSAVLRAFNADIIFLDPARRSSDGNKVFLLEDCSPDVLTLLPSLLESSRHLMLKLSPMADISMVVDRINSTYEKHLESISGVGWNGNWIREIHVVASGGECKELLVWMDREWEGEYTVHCREDGGVMSFGASEIADAKAVLPESVYLKYLFEPGKSLAKAGAFNALCGRFGLVKLARSTNLFSLGPVGAPEASPAAVPAANGAWAPYASRPIRVNVRPGALPPEQSPVILSEAEDLLRFGKVYQVEEVVKMNKAGMKDVGKRFPKSEVSARNIPLTSAELRSRLGVKSGDDAHMFGVRIETPFQADNFLLVCHRI